MIRKALYYIILALVAAILLHYALSFKGGAEAMVAQVESEVTAISYQKPVLVRNIFVTPGQVVEAGELLIEVERPDLKLDFERLIKEKQQLEHSIQDAHLLYRNAAAILDTKHENNKNELLVEKEELEQQLRTTEQSRLRLDTLSSLSFSYNDTLVRKKILLLEEQLSNLDLEFHAEKHRLTHVFEADTFTFRSELSIVNKELTELESEQSQLQRRAERRSTIGNLFVQLDELVPPYQTLLSLYDINPTQIKAFVHERGVEDLDIGDRVMVRSVNKNYEIEGHIVEIGSRITAYPDKINPLVNQNSYGQEVFIKIPEENLFLNGQKVFVYLLEDEK